MKPAATPKTADSADNVLVGHLVSNQPLTGGQTSSPSPPLCGAFLGQGHILVTAGRSPGCCRFLPGPGAAHPHPRVPLGGCRRLPTPEDWCPATRWQRPQPCASCPQAPCPSRGDSPPHGFLLICLCNELGVCYEPGRVISRRRLVPASPAGLCQCRDCVRGGHSLHPPAAFLIHLPPLWHGDGAESHTQPGVSPAHTRTHCHAFPRALPVHPQNQCSPVCCIPSTGISTTWQAQGSSSCPAGHSLSLPSRAHTELP